MKFNYFDLQLPSGNNSMAMISSANFDMMNI